MSGGLNKKKVNKTQGWEVAGSEFYQESYPSNAADFDVLQQNPKHLATLLPSKQNRAATIKLRNNSDTRTFRRQQSMRRESTFRRASVAAEVQVAMMPDLSQNLSNEQTTWQEIMELKAMPIPMAQKREMKSKLQNEPNLRLQGYEQFKWKHKRMLEKFKLRLNEAYQKLELWRGTLKNIEGNFGTGVVAYFLFIKWLMRLNLCMFVPQFFFVILPMLLSQEKAPVECSGGERNSTECCTANYFNSSSGSNLVLDLFQGRGEMEKTVFFYGPYSNETLQYYLNGSQMYYNLPLAYVAVPIFYFLFSLIAIVKAAAKGFKERLVEGEGQFYHYCNLVICSWDFCIDNKKSAGKKQEAIFKEIKSSLEIERLEEERKCRTRNEKTKLLAIRIVVNFVVVLILFLGAAIIYFVFDFSTNKLVDYVGNSISFDTDSILRLFYEFLPSIIIVLLNMTVPFLFQYLVSFENYSPIFVVRLTLVRTVFLRLFSLFVLYASLYKKISCEREEDECTSTSCNTPMCWETFVGQQMYKLALTDFATHVFITFVVNFIRSRIGRLENRFAKLIGEQYFDLPKHVLDVVYLQTVSWFGSFYAPCLPALFTIIFFAMFFVKRFACLVNSRPSSTVYRASRSNSMFMIVLLVSFIFALIPVAFSVAELVPSKSCGPFRGLNSVWEVVTVAFHYTPHWIQKVVFFLSTAGFGIPVFIVLCLTLYYYIAVTSANRHMVVVLKHQLVLEGHDKQFLLEKLSSFIKQQQKRSRQPEGDRNVVSN
ncbi:PREDICTED: transmembrane channel-like protein 7 [Nicrophorus vespilloides]|uniref:Transmembrane channel-like protein 7 n=1 Tax=Nicrophorus vespilloides TaxID=110193 RepID=A0ABM1N336_NICVS|nr:PREDICTED: transmembrane channel-like protein 7 [Nicrophorus vespilloides]